MSQPPVVQTPKNNVGDLGDVNWQTFQYWYNEITGKKESIRKSFNDPVQLGYNDIEDIHIRVKQTAQPYSKVAESMSVKVSFSDKATEEYSSFERFKIQASAGNTAVKSVTLEYNYAFKASESDNVGNHKITIEIFSGLAVFQEVQQEVPKFFWRNLGYRTVNAYIDYVDISIANSFMAAITNWVHSRKRAPKKKVFDWVQHNSHFSSLLTRVFILMACAFFLVSAVDTHLLDSTNQTLAKFLIVAAALAWLLNEMARLLGRTIEKSIDQIWKISYLKLNEGDERLIQEIKDNNKSCWISIGWKTLVYVALTGSTALIKQVMSGLI